MSVAEIIATRGIEDFRRLEKAALSELPLDRDLLLAVGGGCVETESNVSALQSGGVVIWLDAVWEVLRERIEQGAAVADRPLVAELGWEGLEKLYRWRQRLYAAAADFRIRSDRQSVAATGRSALLKSLLWRRRQRRRAR